MSYVKATGGGVEMTTPPQAGGVPSEQAVKKEMPDDRSGVKRYVMFNDLVKIGVILIAVYYGYQYLKKK